MTASSSLPMRAQDWVFWVGAPLLAGFALDQWIVPGGVAVDSRYGPLSAIGNAGAAGVAAFVALGAMGLQYLLPHRLPGLRASLSILCAGMLCLTWERLNRGFPLAQRPGLDLGQWMAWAGSALALFFAGRSWQELFPQQDLRTSLRAKRTYQLRTSFEFAAAGLTASTILGTLSYAFFRKTLEGTSLAPAAIESRLESFALLYSSLALVVTVSLFAVGVVISHRTAGPIRAFVRFIQDWSQGRSTRLRLRPGDGFRELEMVSELITRTQPPQGKPEADSSAAGQLRPAG